jgi:lipoprotein-releasing system permease protein
MSVSTTIEKAEDQSAVPKAPRPFSRFERMLATRYLLPKRREGFIAVISILSLLGVMIGVAALIAVLSVMKGFRHELIRSLVGVNGHVFVYPITGEGSQPFIDYQDVADRIAMVNGVARAIPLIEGQAFASTGAGSGFALVRGMRESDIARVNSLKDGLQDGNFEGFDTAETPAIALGAALAERLGALRDDTIKIINPRGRSTVAGTAVIQKGYPVSAIFRVGVYALDEALVIMPLREAQLFFQRETEGTETEEPKGLADMVEVTLENVDAIDSMMPDIEAAAGRAVVLSDYRRRYASNLQVLDIERYTMSMILTLIIIVAALNIISGLYMLVRTKSRDIAILKTMGADRGSVLRIFLMAGASIGVLGTILGTVLGLVIARNVESIRQFIAWVSGTPIFDPKFYQLPALPSRVEMGDVTFVVIVALSLSLLASLYPAWKASRVDPVKALRNE